jgi:predicted Rdx family selenoprotein
VAAQICAGRNREVGVTLTPVGQGRFEIYLNGELVYNRKAPLEILDVKDPIGDIRGGVQVAEQVRTKLLSALEAANAQASPAGATAH